jgi:hypothetical protein
MCEHLPSRQAATDIDIGGLFRVFERSLADERGLFGFLHVLLI